MIEQILINADKISKSFENNDYKVNRIYSLSEIPLDMLESKKPAYMKVGFHQVPIGIYLEKIEGIINIILPPYKREHEITNFFENFKQ